MATRIDELYEHDFYVWTQRQAEALRRLAETRPNVELDFPHLIEEVEDLGTSQRDAARSQLRRIIEHCLQPEYSRALDPRAGSASPLLPTCCQSIARTPSTTCLPTAGIQSTAAACPTTGRG